VVETSTRTNEKAAASAGPPVSRRVELRRFHHGDPRSRGAELPAGVLPASLAGYRSVEIGGDWPLVVTADVERRPFARPLGAALAELAASSGERLLTDQVPRIERQAARRLGAGGEAPLAELLVESAKAVAAELQLAGEEAARLVALLEGFAALDPGAVVFGYGEASLWQLVDRVARRRAAAARRRLSSGLTELAAAATTLLEADDARRPESSRDPRRVERLGALGGKFVDPARLAGVVAQKRAGEPFSEERRAALEAARQALAEHSLESPTPFWTVPRGVAPSGLAASPFACDDPCAEACVAFDRAAEDVVRLVRAARLVELERNGVFDPDLHLPGLERLDWRSFTADELALVTPVVALVRPRDLLTAGLQSLTRLLLSGRPVQVIVESGDGFESAAPSLARFEPGYLGLGHREAYVHQGSLARAAALAQGLEAAFAGTRPALHVIDVPTAGPDDLDPWLVASARVTGRAAPLFRYEPEAGPTWARRLRFDDNPAAEADWPTGALPPDAVAAGAPAEAPFTYADAALLDPAWRSHFALADGATEELAEIADWLSASDAEQAKRLPFVWAASGDGTFVRLVVSRALAWATRDRLELWRTLEELAGVRSEHVDEAVRAAREAAEEKARSEREELLAAHAAELERVRSEAASGAVSRIVAGLFGGAGDGVAALVAPAATGGGAPAAAPAAASAAPSAAPAAAPPSEVWVDSALCTSCDECTRKYPTIFVYNADKQATVKNPRGGSFRDLVKAAEACPARVIHPGEPWDLKEKDLAAWVERAKKFE